MARFRSILLVTFSALVLGCQMPATNPPGIVPLDEITYADQALPLADAAANTETVLPAALLLGESDTDLSGVPRSDEIMAPAAPKTC
jgi:hypothetical protein